MIFQRRPALLCAVPLLTAGAATAADKQPTLDGEYINYAETSRVLSGAAQCIILKDPSKAKAVFEVDLFSSEQNARLQKLFEARGPGCLFFNPLMKTNYMMALGYMTEELMRREPVAPMSPVAAPGFVGGGNFKWTAVNLSEIGRTAIMPPAQCIVARHPADASTLLATRQTSNSERKVFNSISADLADCMPAGQTVTLHPMYLRSAIALFYYAASHPATPVAAAQGTLH